MTRTEYLAAVIAAYLNTPGTPNRASRSDWAVASTLFNQHIPLENVVHAIRLATLRRLDSANLDPISSLAYFRHVALRLTKDELDPTYLAYVNSKFQQHIAQHEPECSETAASPPISRAS